MHLLHNFLASFCETIADREDDNKYLSTPISHKRSIVVKASLVCNVDRTKWPVIEALTAILAVSVSRISPIITISGSCLKIDLKTFAKSKPISLLVCTWLIPSISISIGSSTVIIFVSSWFNLFKIEYTVVDLPEPVAPVTRIIPLGAVIACSTFFKLVSVKPSDSIPDTCLL